MNKLPQKAVCGMQLDLTRLSCYVVCDIFELYSLSFYALQRSTPPNMNLKSLFLVSLAPGCEPYKGIRWILLSNIA